MKKKNIIITICIVIAIIIIALGLILLVPKDNSNNNNNNQLPEKTSTEVKDGKAEKIMYDGIKISGSYKTGVMNIELENTTKDDYLITAVTMTTYKDDKKVKENKFEVNQILEAGKDTTMSFMVHLEDFDRIEYNIVKKKV